MPKKKITIWTDEEIVTYLQLEAANQNTSLSEVANTLLKKSFTTNKELTGSDLIAHTLKTELRREFSGLANRITSLLARTALESTSSRFLIVQTLAQLLDDDTQAKDFNRTAWLFAVDQLKRPSSEFRQLLKEWREQNPSPPLEPNPPDSTPGVTSHPDPNSLDDYTRGD